MQDPNEDTEWNDILRQKGIIPQKEKEITEEQIVSMLEETIESKTGDVQDLWICIKCLETLDMENVLRPNGWQVAGRNFDCSAEAGEVSWRLIYTKGGKDLSKLDLDELDELEDSEDEAILLEYRNKRIAELKALAERAKFGSVGEISAQDYVNEVNKAGEGIWVVLHLYKQGIPLCALINEHLKYLAVKFPTVKFLKSISTTCIPNYPDKNLPTVFVYFEGELKKQYVGPLEFRGPNLTLEEFEYILGKSGAIETDIKEDPRPKIKDKLFSDLADTNDW